ncbi:MAG TPA: response regulator [Anaerolineae bacterium]|nr:response regulator [Anaerolineales bacterium]HRV92242.1 response regulator [Anaerolineae bacterium]
MAGGPGSLFWFDLNLPEAANRIEPVESDQRPIVGYQGQRLKILIADDNPENRELLAAILRPLGFEIVEAVNGVEALDRAVTLQPDLVLLDLVMPELGGLEVVRRIRQNPDLKEVVVIAISASAFEQTRQESLIAGCHDLITKPFNLDELLDRLQHHLKLEWIYDEPPLPPTPKTEPRPLNIPPQETLEALLKLARMRNITGLRQAVTQLKTETPQFTPFAAQIETWAGQYQFKPLAEFIETHLKGPK